MKNLQKVRKKKNKIKDDLKVLKEEYNRLQEGKENLDDLVRNFAGGLLVCCMIICLKL